VARDSHTFKVEFGNASFSRKRNLITRHQVKKENLGRTAKIRVNDAGAYQQSEELHAGEIDSTSYLVY
jgi:hypothetical protein